MSTYGYNGFFLFSFCGSRIYNVLLGLCTLSSILNGVLIDQSLGGCVPVAYIMAMMTIKASGKMFWTIRYLIQPGFSASGHETHYYRVPIENMNIIYSL